MGWTSYSWLFNSKYPALGVGGL